MILRKIHHVVGSKYNGQLFVVLLSSAVIIGSTSLIPLYLARSFSALINEENYSPFIMLLSICYLLRAIFKLLRNHFAAMLGNYVVMDIRNVAVRNILHNKALSVEANRCYTNLTYDIHAISEIISWRLFMFLEDLFILLLCFIQMFRISWVIAVSSIPCIILLLWITTLYGRKIELAVVHIRDSVTKMALSVYEIITGQKLFRVLNKQQLANSKFSTANNENCEANLQLNQINLKYSPLLEGFAYINLLLALFFSSLLIVHEQLDTGALVAFNNYMWLLFGTVGNLSSLALFYVNSKESMKRISTYMEYPEYEPSAHNITDFKRLDLEQVSISINNKMELHDIDLSLNKGEVTAITGEIGSGKTLLIEIIAGLVHQYKGVIKVDGSVVNPLKRSSLRIGYAMQIPPFFNGTIKENILLGRNNITDSDYEEIIKICRLSDLINRVELKDHTIISKESNILSGGEKQRISIARALIGNPDLLLIDDAVTAIDSHNQDMILNQLFALKNNLILVMTTNQPNIIARSDNVWRLKDGSLHSVKGGGA